MHQRLVKLALGAEEEEEIELLAQHRRDLAKATQSLDSAQNMLEAWPGYPLHLNFPFSRDSA